jgi:eukaryotic-like serine/threonine-protein kinase
VAGEVQVVEKRSDRLRNRQRLDKYRIEGHLAEGPYAAVYRAYDMIEGVRVALKIPHPHLLNEEFLEEFRREVRLASRLDHEHVLPIKNASFIGDLFVIAMPLGERNLADRLKGRIAFAAAIELAQMAIEAVAHAHRKHIIHCDIKPENFILFPGGRLRLSDFGIARMALRHTEASGSGTIGYMSPEQALGHPSYRSDVFSLGLLLYRLLSGHLPQWPFDWPPAGFERLRGRVHPDLIDLMRRSLALRPEKRYADADLLLRRFLTIRPKALRYVTLQRRRAQKHGQKQDWQEIRRRQFQRRYGRLLETRHRCVHCGGPVAESMRHCPWCKASRAKHRGETTYPASCPRCGRGVKLDWKYCPWCYGGSIGPLSGRSYTDRRYTARCANRGCPRREIMPWMRYCPWCNRAIRKRWPIEEHSERCPSCGWGVLRSFWSYCPWCGRGLEKR